MSKVKNLFIITVLLYYQTGNANAQLGISAANVVAHGVVALAGGSREAKQEKIIDQSTKQEKINGSTVNVLRVKESAIKSKAKNHIIALQNRLDQYKSQYQNNQPIDIPKSDSDLIAIQDKDENWPVEYYVGELKVYKRYAFQQKQKAQASPSNNLNTTPADAVKKDSVAAN